MALRIVFAGTPEFALPCLRAAGRCGDVVAVYTQPDRPAGRGRQLTPSPVKVEALANNWRVEQPANFKTIDSKNVLREFNADLMIVVAYGLLLPQSVLDIPKLLTHTSWTNRKRNWTGVFHLRYWQIKFAHSVLGRCAKLR